MKRVKTCIIVVNGFTKKNKIKITCIQIVSSCRTYKSNLVQREGRIDISDILWHLLSKKICPFLYLSKFTFAKNYEKSQKFNM